ncbi:MAG: hypothetical protein BLM47_11600 [Candidatus Reconcilbacillus cellulovorans]|uniref:TIGR02677 family protein n=1 Tax=Candidatus Reconcilbacillus cellulovorans TaxID=1906605 RepID=A0A2A6DXU9_9BACL|nr:MAG: hypothetical protein BLM47_11600 [Candidatus Reconcilbacillus cellulovorans]
MNLFDIVPETLFQLLAGPNRRLYAEALLLLYEHARRERFGVPLPLMRDVFQELIESYRERGVEFAAEEEDAAGTEDTADEDKSRAQANALIRRLVALKWIDVEVRDRYESFIVLPRYSSRLLALFAELCEDRAVEYQRFAFAAYQMLHGKEAAERPYAAVREALDVSRRLEHELVVLYNNIKNHMEQVIAKQSLEDVLHHHFVEYQSNIVDRSYHRLKTSDHVARYRGAILDCVRAWLTDARFLAAAAEDGVRGEWHATREEAEAAVREALLELEAIYTGLDELYRQIDWRHNQYLRASYERARYLGGTRHLGMERKIAGLLERIGRLGDRLPDGAVGDAADVRLSLIRPLSDASLYAPRRRRPPHEPPPHVVEPVPEAWREAVLAAGRERAAKAVTREKVERFVLERMGDREAIDMVELAPADEEEFLLFSFVYLYGYDRGSAFRIERAEGRLAQFGPYRFHNHRLVRSDRKVKRP